MAILNFFAQGETGSTIIDLHADDTSPTGVRFDDSRWKTHIGSLKPVGLACVLNARETAVACARVAGIPGAAEPNSTPTVAASAVGGGANKVKRKKKKPKAKADSKPDAAGPGLGVVTTPADSGGGVAQASRTLSLRHFVPSLLRLAKATSVADAPPAQPITDPSATVAVPSTVAPDSPFPVAAGSLTAPDTVVPAHSAPLRLPPFLPSSDSARGSLLSRVLRGSGVRQRVSFSPSDASSSLPAEKDGDASSVGSSKPPRSTRFRLPFILQRQPDAGARVVSEAREVDTGTGAGSVSTPHAREGLDDVAAHAVLATASPMDSAIALSPPSMPSGASVVPSQLAIDSFFSGATVESADAARGATDPSSGSHDTATKGKFSLSSIMPSGFARGVRMWGAATTPSPAPDSPGTIASGAGSLAVPVGNLETSQFSHDSADATCPLNINPAIEPPAVSEATGSATQNVTGIVPTSSSSSSSDEDSDDSASEEEDAVSEYSTKSSESDDGGGGSTADDDDTDDSDESGAASDDSSVDSARLRRREQRQARMARRIPAGPSLDDLTAEQNQSDAAGHGAIPFVAVAGCPLVDPAPTVMSSRSAPPTALSLPLLLPLPDASGKSTAESIPDATLNPQSPPLSSRSALQPLSSRRRRESAAASLYRSALNRRLAGRATAMTPCDPLRDHNSLAGDLVLASAVAASQIAGLVIDTRPERGLSYGSGSDLLHSPTSAPSSKESNEGIQPRRLDSADSLGSTGDSQWLTSAPLLRGDDEYIVGPPIVERLAGEKILSKPSYRPHSYTADGLVAALPSQPTLESSDSRSTDPALASLPRDVINVPSNVESELIICSSGGDASAVIPRDRGDEQWTAAVGGRSDDGALDHSAASAFDSSAETKPVRQSSRHRHHRGRHVVESGLLKRKVGHSRLTAVPRVNVDELVQVCQDRGLAI